MFSNVRYPSFAGTSVPRDFVEYPSQVNEMWADWPSVLAHYARHYQTGAPMPRALLDKVAAAKRFNQGFLTTEYLSASVLDPFCRTHDVANLFVVDASFFPSSSAVNPGLTIVAQALRAADHIRDTVL